MYEAEWVLTGSTAPLPPETLDRVLEISEVGAGRLEFGESTLSGGQSAMQPFAERLALAASDADPARVQEDGAAGAEEPPGGNAAGADGSRPSKAAREDAAGAKLSEG